VTFDKNLNPSVPTGSRRPTNRDDTIQARGLADYSFDLSEFDSVAQYLHLEINSAEMFQWRVSQRSPHAVTRSVINIAFAGWSDESDSRFLGILPIAE
jgi:hypothetical protein